ncbi:MAG: polyphosphate polymerase domain-containing protein [Lachnospiraceae bacterium]
MPQNFFKRYEKKYLLSTLQYHILLSRMEGLIQADTYGKYSISNIYFDTPDFSMIRTSLDKPLYKEKLRLRSYGFPTQDSTVFLEIKKKYDGIVYKRRTSLSLSDAERYLYRGTHTGQTCQVLKEIDWLFTRYPLMPAVFLAYDRTAYRGNADKELRITFDTNIRGRQDWLSLTAGADGTAILPPDTVLMEVKFPGAMPLWMSRLFAELQIRPVSFSKYGTYYQEIICSDKKGNQKYA